MNVSPELLKKCTDGMANSGIQPSPSDISSVCEITGVGRPEATVLLKKWPNWQDAITHYFDDPVQALRQEVSNRQWETADSLPYVNELDMSRPPSRTEQFSGKYYDLTDVHAQAMAPTRVDYDMEDAELKRAMEASMQEMPRQESGVTTSGQQFGPANRPYYEPSRWAVSAPVASSREVIDHPSPAKRRRLDGQPAFLRGSVETGYVAPLLNIYYSIPLAREAFLFPQLQVYVYTHDPSWWSGSTDENDKSLSSELTHVDDRDRRNLICELQCLMAFLDETDRAYGSVDALTDLRAFKNYPFDNGFSRLLEAWKHAAMMERRDEPLTQVFASTAVKDEGFRLKPVEKPLVCLVSPVDRRENQTFTELLDNVVWNDSPDMPLDDVWLEHVGEIFTMHLYDPEKSPGGIGIDIEETWYPDRYMNHLREATRNLRQEKMTLFQEIFRLGRVQQSIVEMPAAYAKRTDIRRLLEFAANFADTAVQTTLSDENALDHADSQVDVAKMKTEMTNLLERISTKLDDIQTTKAQLYAETRRVTSQLTKPAPEYPDALSRKYVLQGLSTKPNVTYVRHRSQNLIELEDEEENSTLDGWQWWRIAWNELEEPSPPMIGPQPLAQAHPIGFSRSGGEEEPSSAYSVRRVTIEQVREAAKTEHNEIVLVYVSENALNYEPRPISNALRQFVEQDNQAFEREMRESQAGKSAGRGRSWSEDTNDTINNRDPFRDNVDSQQQMREMTPMSMSTIRDSDGQPSPKRPRSSDDSTPEYGGSDDPPPYEDGESEPTVEMHEKKGNKIGFFTDQLMEKYGGVDDHSQDYARNPG